MTEASVDEIYSELSKLKSASRIIVLLGSPEGLKGISKKLLSLQGVLRVRRGVFIVRNYSEIHNALLQSYSVTSFSRTQEIPPIRERRRNTYSDRVYALVSFSYDSPTMQQKKYVERLIRRTTGIRLRPGVILFPLLRSKDSRRIIGLDDDKVLIDSNEFTKLVRINGGNALRWSRLKIDNVDGVRYIEDAVQHTLSRDLVALEKGIRNLRDQLRDSDITIGQLKRSYTRLSRSFREAKTKWMLARKLWNHDSEKALKRTYNMLINTRRAIVSTENKRLN